MATQADVRRIALSLPETEEVAGRFAFARSQQGQAEGLRLGLDGARRAKEAPRAEPKVIAVRIANLDDRELMIAVEPSKFFTEPHYEGFPAVLVRLPAVTARELGPLITEALALPGIKGLESDGDASSPSNGRAEKTFMRMGVQ